MKDIDPKSIINRTWWLLMLQGMLAGLFGLAVLYNPGAPFVHIAFLVAAFWMIGGLLDMFGGLFKYGADPDWWIGFLTGLLGVIAGAVLLTHANAILTAPPAVGGRALATPLVAAVGLIAAVVGLANLAAATRLRARIAAEAATVLWGVIQLVFGVWFAASPLTFEVLTVIGSIAAFAIIGGISLTVFGFRMKWIRGDVGPAPISGGSAPISGGSRRREG